MSPKVANRILTIALIAVVVGALAFAIIRRAGEPDDVQWQPTGIENTDWQCDGTQLLYRYRSYDVNGEHASIATKPDLDRRCLK
jgi:hypothetical protein